MEPDLIRVLVVDDEEATRSLLAQTLSGPEFRVDPVASAEEALTRLASEPEYDVVMTDLVMPGMSGEELALAISRDHPETGVVIMTGQPSLESAKAAVRAQACDYVEKPFDDLDQLRERVREIGERRQRSQLHQALVRNLAEKNRTLEVEQAQLLRKVSVTQRNLKEQMRSLQKSREAFYSDLARVMAILDNLVDGIVFTDPEGNVILLNPAAGKMLGLPPFTAMGRPLSRVEGNRILLSLLAAHRALVLDEDGAQADVTTKSDGRDAHYSVHSSPIPDFQGKLSGTLSLIRDISLRKKTEHLKNQFLSIVAHELRTPLTTIKAFATILDKGVYGELRGQQQAMVDNILSQSDRLGHEIDKIISLGRLEASDFSPDLNEVPAKRILTKIPVPFESAAKEKGIRLTLTDESKGAVVLADTRDIQRALRALVENALKFTPEGGEVEIRATTEDEHVVFEVRDDGIGIAPQDHEVIFERFIQLENPLTRQHGGSGLGLSFAAEIMKAHGTRIEVESELGEGAVFRFRLPRVCEQTDQLRDAASALRMAKLATNQRLAT